MVDVGGCISNNRIILLSCVVSACVAMIFGIIIGHFGTGAGGAGGTIGSVLKQKCGVDPTGNTATDKYLENCQLESCKASTCDIPSPKNLVAYHLGSDVITMDGKLDEPAWTQAPKADGFTDMRGPEFEAPWFDTYMKLRWDDQYLYFGGQVRDDDIWGYATQKDTALYNRDNCIEIYVDADISNHGYKQIEVNALGTSWDASLSKPYVSGGGAKVDWHHDGETKIYVDGSLNDPTGGKDNYWQFEIRFPWAVMVNHTTLYRAGYRPNDGDQMKMQFSRVEWRVDVLNGRYVKKPGVPQNFWVWNPQFAANMHIPERWGLVEFRRDIPAGSATYRRWPNWTIFKALFETFHGMTAHRGEFGVWPTDIRELRKLPPYVLSGKCVRQPILSKTPQGWRIQISPVGSGKIGSVDQDRKTTFT